MAKKKNSKKKKKKKDSSLSFLFWVALLLLIILLVLLNKNKISSLIDEIKAQKSGEQATKIEKEEPKQSKQNKDKNIEYELLSPKKEEPKQNKTTAKKEEPKDAKQQQESTKPTQTQPKPTADSPTKKQPSQSQSTQTPTSSPNASSKESKQIEENRPTTPVKKTASRKLYFLLSSDSDPLRLHAISRDITVDDSPLLTTLNSLFSGIKSSEYAASPELLSAIPANSKILSIKVTNSIATISLNQAFANNPFAKEGLLASLKQIVFTATEFSTVTQVQFLLEGKNVDYLGPEGVYIAKPLSRSSF